ncbi:unnamed protein product [Eruca vesicaria subsp. sativa]|uniref:Uncharacterized protein n=1 Tax=Eruca vesicaria subsp. sativa TaxID=29727 RepID=A0ABC8LQ93_ERUVS|nr:unnamed protein product [Eruca vesicaria subsp. sativa]
MTYQRNTMTYHAESSSFRRSRSIGGRRMCDCGLPAKIFTSWTNKNPGRKFLVVNCMRQWAMNIATSFNGTMKGKSMGGQKER